MRAIKTDLGVAACLIENNKILLVKEAKGPQKSLWGLPKGSVDDGELPQLAIKRELREECGIDADIRGLVGIRECLIKQTPAIFLAYLVDSKNPIVNICNDEIADYGWYDVNDFQTLSWISEAMKEIAEKALTNYEGEMIDYSEERGRSYFLYL
ncbi:MAG: NUDIX hydrolase [Candidatus Thalassarchaeaceae archaeon]|jgi:ADP-ribose pyrophosphatase YjhB (NUDIX family)|nr:NUDIX hydrolase [Candidatus Thalassarchaeaceae archaeon]|tara:strand:+ start:132 stop:593 length:462 start_codon:yes stop_codon:yes gene_type:complete